VYQVIIEKGAKGRKRGGCHVAVRFDSDNKRHCPSRAGIIDGDAPAQSDVGLFADE